VLQQMRSSAKYLILVLILVFIGGFLLYDVAGLGQRPTVTSGTTVATVNGHTVTYQDWLGAYTPAVRQAQTQQGQLNDDELMRIQNEAFEELVNNIILEQEIRRRGITVSEAEIRQAALSAPPQEFLTHPDFQTEGRFDMEKYRRFITSPVAAQQGVQQMLVEYYRRELPRLKLYQQVAATAYVTDGQLWRAWRDQRDSVQVSFVALSPETVPDTAVRVTDDEIRSYFRTHQDRLGDRPGRAVLSVVRIPRVVTAEDSARTRQRAVQLRQEILEGASFADVAQRASEDPGSAERGGALGPTFRGQLVPEFEQVAFSIRPGEISQPVLSSFGYHLIQVDSRRADTVEARHILLRIEQGEESAREADRVADELARVAARVGDAARFDSAARALNLPVTRTEVREGEPVFWEGSYVPGASGWAFSGVSRGETSDLIDADEAYYMARIDSLQRGGAIRLEDVRAEIRAELMREKKLDALMPRGREIAAAVARGQTLEQAGSAAGLTVERTDMFTRGSTVPGIGQFNEAVGAAFALPVGATSDAVRARTGVYLLRVERRVVANREAWEQQRDQQRNETLSRVRQGMVQQFLTNLRQDARIEDRRREVEAAARGVTT
jgi:peptidyl-prolyl cis-trans isomerase D